MSHHFGLACAIVGLMLFTQPAGSLAAAQQTRHTDDNVATPTSIPWPEADLIAARNYQNQDAIRRHAWAVFTAISQPLNASRPDGAAQWEMWHSRAETFNRNLGECSEDSARRDSWGARLRASKIAPRILTVVVLYNDAACQHIRQLALFRFETVASLADKLNSLAAPNYEHDIPPFPRSAMIVKANWRRIPRSGGTIPVWVPGESSSRRARVRVSSRNEPCLLSTWDGESPIPTSCFRSIVVTSRNHQMFPQQTVDDGDVYVLVGFHVITKELPEWTWTTLWWSPRPDEGPFAQGRPDAKTLRGVWRNYAMDATLSMDTPSDSASVASPSNSRDDCSPTAIQQTARACFNPYLEGRSLADAKISNCMNCHVHATYPPMPKDFRDTVSQGYVDPNASCFKNRIRMDYLWSLVPRIPNAQNPPQTAAAFQKNTTRNP